MFFDKVLTQNNIWNAICRFPTVVSSHVFYFEL